MLFLFISVYKHTQHRLVKDLGIDQSSRFLTPDSGVNYRRRRLTAHPADCWSSKGKGKREKTAELETDGY